MGVLTKSEALIAELEPYTPSKLTLTKALADVGINDIDMPYNSLSDKPIIAKAAISVLKQMIVLTSDSLGKSSQGYSVDMLNKRIKTLCKENGLDASDFVDDELSTIEDGSNMW